MSEIHSCSYYCTRPACVLAQRNEMRDKQAEPVAWIPRDHLRQARFGPFLCRVEPTQRRPDFVALYTAPPAPQQAEPVVSPIDRDVQAELRVALHRISLASQNSMSSKEECGRIARNALHAVPEQQAEPVESSAERTLSLLGYTNEGGEYWKPPLGKPKQAEPVAAHKVATTTANGQFMTQADSGNPSY